MFKPHSYICGGSFFAAGLLEKFSQFLEQICIKMRVWGTKKREPEQDHITNQQIGALFEYMDYIKAIFKNMSVSIGKGKNRG